MNILPKELLEQLVNESVGGGPSPDSMPAQSKPEFYVKPPEGRLGKFFRPPSMPMAELDPPRSLTNFRGIANERIQNQPRPNPIIQLLKGFMGR